MRNFGTRSAHTSTWFDGRMGNGAGMFCFASCSQTAGKYTFPPPSQTFECLFPSRTEIFDCVFFDFVTHVMLHHFQETINPRLLFKYRTSPSSHGHCNELKSLLINNLFPWLVKKRGVLKCRLSKRTIGTGVSG